MRVDKNFEAMSASRSYRTEALVIKHRWFGEAGKLLTLYTLEYGKVQAIAKGVKRPGSKLSGHVDLLTHSQLMLARGRNLDIVTQAQTINPFIELKSDLERLSCGLYVAELVDGFTEDRMESRAIFDLTLNTLQRLSQATSLDTVLRYFELHLVHHLGYRPQLHNCASCGTPLRPVTNFFHPVSGGVLCPDCGMVMPEARRLSLNAFKVLRLWQGCSYGDACRVRINRELADELEMVLRSYLKYLLERDLKATAWLDRLKRERAVGNLPGTADVDST
ncbi:MAG: DNA repair protein RecO, partial [Dehalococcoidia bacterium]|nr:DNA repair protein RecO [Dehalococcoidia bacterium]